MEILEYTKIEFWVFNIKTYLFSWKTHGGAAIVNAFYSPNENSIQFPAGILDGVFFKVIKRN